jgi:hypothetical protein
MRESKHEFLDRFMVLSSKAYFFIFVPSEQEFSFWDIFLLSHKEHALSHENGKKGDGGKKRDGVS